jgi:hypothetical protein
VQEREYMGELKSAWEIAQEKANKLGKLSVKEEQRQREEKCRQIGRALTQRWLGSSEGQNLVVEVNNYPEEEKSLIVRAVLDYLAEAIDLQSAKPGVSGLERAVQGIARLQPKSQPITERITKLAQEYEQAEKKARREMESNYRETLHQLRISGTAVGDINLEIRSDWQQAQQELAELFRPRLDSLKEELVCNFEGMC